MKISHYRIFSLLLSSIFIVGCIWIMTWWNAKYVHPDLRRRALKIHFDGSSILDSADRFIVDPSSLHRWKQIYLETGDVLTEKERLQQIKQYKKPHKNKKLQSDEARNILYGTLNHSSVSYLKEYQENLLNNSGIKASLSTISRFWAEEEITRKKCSIFATESDPLDVEGFWYDYYYAVRDENQLLFGDESDRNDNTSIRRYGRAPKGERAYQMTNLTKGKYKLSLLLFADATGPVVYDVYNGGVNGDLFLDFAWNQLSDFINPYPGPHSVIIIDNASIHHTIVLSLDEFSEWESLLSLCDSTERQKGKAWRRALEKLGYVT